jgi:hypothetical protein
MEDLALKVTEHCLVSPGADIVSQDIFFCRHDMPPVLPNWFTPEILQEISRALSL